MKVYMLECMCVFEILGDAMTYRGYAPIIDLN